MTFGEPHGNGRDAPKADIAPMLPGRSSTKPLLFPTQAEGKSPTELVSEYLGGTPFTDLLLTPVPFEPAFLG